MTVATSVTYQTIARTRPSLESDGDYDGTSEPMTSTELTAEITYISGLVDIAYADASQTAKDGLITLIVKSELDDMINFMQSQNKDSSEADKKSMLTDKTRTMIADLVKRALEASKGSDYPRIDYFDLR